MSNINVVVHFESEIAGYETSVSDTVGQVQSRAARELLIPEGVSAGLTLMYQGKALENAGESLNQLLKGATEERIELRLDFRLIVNTVEKYTPKKFVTGSEILVLAGSPSDWV